MHDEPHGERPSENAASIDVRDAVGDLHDYLFEALAEGSLTAANALRLLSRAFGAAGAMIETRGGGDVVCSVAVGALQTAEGCTSGSDRSLFGFAPDPGSLLVVGDCDGDERVIATRCRALGAASLLSCAIGSEESLVIVDLVSAEKHAFARADADLFAVASRAVVDASKLVDALARREAETMRRIDGLVNEVRRESEFLRLLQEIAIAANESLTVEQAIYTAIEKVCRVTGWPVGHLYLVDETSDRLMSTPVWYMENQVRFNALRRVTQGIEWREGIGLAGRVLRDGRPEWMLDVRKDPSFIRTRLAASLGVRSSFAFPIFVESEVAGVLEFYSTESVEPDERLLEIVLPIGTQLGRVIERKRAEMALSRSEQRHRLLFERNLAGVFRTDAEGRIDECNDALARMFGLESRSAMQGRPFLDLLSSRDDRQKVLSALEESGVLTGSELRVVREDGKEAWALANISRTSEESTAIEGTLIDITERKKIEEEYAFQARHDSLTGLPNRAYFMAQFEKALALARRCDFRLALLFIDLDGFKPVNDRWGHAAGDWLLQQVAIRLENGVRTSDLVGRLGGDEFLVLLNAVPAGTDIERIVVKILDSLSEPYRYEGNDLIVTASIGVAPYPAVADDAEALMQAADAAMYEAKAAGRNRYRVAR